METLGYLGIDQYGQHYHIKKYPRKELMAQLGCKHVEKMYANGKNGSEREAGYVIAGLWIDIYKLCKWR